MPVEQALVRRTSRVAFVWGYAATVVPGGREELPRLAPLRGDGSVSTLLELQDPEGEQDGCGEHEGSDCHVLPRSIPNQLIENKVACIIPDTSLGSAVVACVWKTPYL